MKNDNNSKVDCFQCVHFAVTWDKKFPRSCKLFGFKSASLPSATILNSTGMACMGFAKKDNQKERRD